MMKIAHIVSGTVVSTTYTEEQELNFPHVVIDREILEPIESWYIEDGEIKIDQQKLIEFNRKNMPRLTPIEFDIKLVDAGLYDKVQSLISKDIKLVGAGLYDKAQSLISKDIKLRIAYTRATLFSRTDPFIDQVRIALGLTDEQVDEMWTS